MQDSVRRNERTSLREYVITVDYVKNPSSPPRRRLSHALGRVLNGRGHKVLYLDSEGTFRPERLAEIAQRWNLDEQTVASLAEEIGAIWDQMRRFSHCVET